MKKIDAMQKDLMQLIAERKKWQQNIKELTCEIKDLRHEISLLRTKEKFPNRRKSDEIKREGMDRRKLIIQLEDEGLSFDEIAARLGIKTVSAKEFHRKAVRSLGLRHDIDHETAICELCGEKVRSIHSDQRCPMKGVAVK